MVDYKEKNGNLYKNIQKKRSRVESAETGENSHHARGCANLEGVVRNFRTPLEQLSSEGHIFLISAPNRTRFEALDS